MKKLLSLVLSLALVFGTFAFVSVEPSYAATKKPAKVTGLKVVKGAVAESSALGAAAYAAVGMGVLNNPADAYNMTKDKEKVFEPDPVAHAKFEEEFKKYKKLVFSANEIDEMV